MRTVAPALLTIIAVIVLTGTTWAAPVLNPNNGHYYEIVTQQELTWHAAKAKAETKTHLGLQGHLATITSAVENQWLIDNLYGTVNLNAGPGAWIGGYQDHSAPDYSEPAGGWRWVTGEPWSWSYWPSGSPDQYIGRQEDYAWVRQWDYKWDDLMTDYFAGHGSMETDGTYYVVEYEGAVQPGDGRLGFYIEKNGISGYQQGSDSPVANEEVYYRFRNEPWYERTGADGTILIRQLEVSERVFVRHKVYSEPANNRHGHGADLPLFDLWMDNDWISNKTGRVNTPKPITSGQIAQLKRGETVWLELAHPVFEWNLRIDIEFDLVHHAAVDSFASWYDYLYNRLMPGLRDTSRMLYDATDGQMKLGKVVVTNNQGPADVYLREGLWRDPCTLNKPVDSGRSKIVYSAYYDGSDSTLGTTAGSPEAGRWSDALVHELGHYLLELEDEYLDASGTNWYNAGKSPFRSTKDGLKECPTDYGLMDAGKRELSSYNCYQSVDNSAHYIRNGTNKLYPNWSKQIEVNDLKEGGKHRPCWQHVTDRFDNPTPGGDDQPQWSAYNDVQVKLNAPKGGALKIENGRAVIDPGWRNEPESALVKDGPDNSNIRLPYADCTVSFVGFPAIASPPIANAGQTAGLAAVDPLAPKMMISAAVSGTPESSLLSVTVTVDRSLSSPPQVMARDTSGETAGVSVTETSPGAFTGTCHVANWDHGRIDVVAESAGHTTTRSVEFEIQLVREGTSIEMYSPSGALQLLDPQLSFGNDVLGITCESGDPVHLPLDPRLVLLSGPSAFALDVGAMVPQDYALNWSIPCEQLVGVDSDSVAIWQYDSSLRRWIALDSDHGPGSCVVTARAESGGIFAVFGMRSNDHEAPSQIRDLTAEPGERSGEVVLRWTAPGDDGILGNAGAYHLWISEPPDEPQNGRKWPVFLQPNPPGSKEVYRFDSLYPGSICCFAVQAVDGAGNLGQLSNVAYSRSGAIDTDGDGLPDAWEEDFGFDPYAPGEEHQDPDGDGLDNLTEYRLGTDPTDPDTDGDDVPDNQERSETDPPIIQIMPDPGVYYLRLGECMPIRFSVTDDGSGVFDIHATLNGTPVSGGVDLCNPGTYDLQITAIDRCGNSASADGLYRVLLTPDGPLSVYSAITGRSGGPDQHFQSGWNPCMGPCDPIGAVPGSLQIVPGEAWANYVKAAQLDVPYTLKNVVLKKTTPEIVQCADVFPARTVSQQGTPNIRLWWPLMYETAGTTWTLNILYGTLAAWDDDGAGPNPTGYVHTEEWKWILETDIPHMQLMLDLFHELPFGLDEVPLISDEALFSVLEGKLAGIRTLVDDKKFTDAGLLLGDFEMEVMDACIVVSPAKPKPTGPGTGIANTLENPACCKLMADAEYVGKSLGIFQPAK